MSPDPALPYLTHCHGCKGLVTGDHITKGIGRKGEYARLIWLHDCGTEHSTAMTWTSYQRFVRRYHDSLTKSKKSYDTELIGRMVQGFRIDLDVVETPADIEVLWRDQERHRPWTVPQEATV